MRWLTVGQSGYKSPAVLGVPKSLERGGKYVVARWWAEWLHNPCRLRGPNSVERRGKAQVPIGGLGGYISPAA